MWDYDRSWDPPTVETIIQDLGRHLLHRGLVEPAVRDPNFWQRWIDRWQEVRKAITAMKASHSSILSRAGARSRAARLRQVAPAKAWRDPTGRNQFSKELADQSPDFFDTNLLAKPSSTASADSFTLDSSDDGGPEGATISIPWTDPIRVFRAAWIAPQRVDLQRSGGTRQCRDRQSALAQSQSPKSDRWQQSPSRESVVRTHPSAILGPPARRRRASCW